MSTPVTIVVVDDEPMVLNCLSASLELDDDHHVVTFQDPVEALAFIRETEIDLIISDFDLPGMDGIQLLSAVRDHDPSVPRIMLTGYADKESAVKAINKVGLFQYIEKPWSPDDLRIIIRNALEKRALLKKLNEKVGEFRSANNQLQDLRQEILRNFV